MTQLHRVVIVGDNRIPLIRSNIVYTTASNREILTSALEGLVERYNLHGECLGEAVAGAALKHSHDFNLIREYVLGPRLVPEAPAHDIQQACGTGLEMAILVANRIALGQADNDIASGVDITSDTLIGANEGLCKALLEANHDRGNLNKLRSLLKICPRHVVPVIPRNDESYTGLSMREPYELMVQTWQIPRNERDRPTLESHHKPAAIYEEGWQDNLVTPFHGLIRDQNLRPDIGLEKIGTLKPMFECGSRGTLTAASSTPLADGTSVIPLASKEQARVHGLSILAYFKDGEVTTVNFVDRQEGLLIVPAHTVPRLLTRNGLSLRDFDYYKIHEAFAVQALCTLEAWKDPEYCKTRLGLDQPLGSVNRSRLNIKGSSLTTDRPFVAVGGRIVANLAKLFLMAEQGRGLISIRAAGRQDVTATVER